MQKGKKEKDTDLNSFSLFCKKSNFKIIKTYAILFDLHQRLSIIA